MDRAVLEYGVRAGLIFCLAREFDHALNGIIVGEGDPVPAPRRGRHRPRRHRDRTRSSSDARQVDALPGPLRAGARGRARAPPSTPARPGHRRRGRDRGGGAAPAAPHRPRHPRRPTTRRRCGCSASRDVVLELCPTSNLRTHAVSGVGRAEARSSRAFRDRRGAHDRQHRRPVPPPDNPPPRVRAAPRPRGPRPRRRPALRRDRAAGDVRPVGGEWAERVARHSGEERWRRGDSTLAWT